MAASNNFKSLAATRFLLGFFEAACLPLFSMITIAWYRRAEQPVSIRRVSDPLGPYEHKLTRLLSNSFVSLPGTEPTECLP